ncbi:MAG: 2-amino-4-hydroxy-6-hydroxymethyldihydropteridine diphosphokinase [Actinobacteria bacterium]|nr:2-amino-4-hydroxy-6-hydroxymethyldihydropteridine diphosphokinase [Actinomycetota bacterium]MSW61620.1 2-amino-4-hydroxy-6-hydroxymethyldihydropteridine diphosphokinase [Actinomycetota bacterium]MSY44148.1 2-amino-4-hydroxy-6-hydroxymethyldihydropteridine diphosphokinase [Actinomycetota bacterium]
MSRRRARHSKCCDCTQVKATDPASGELCRRSHRTVTARVYLGLGSNLGNSLANLQSAVDGLSEAARITVREVSPVYSTEPVGGPEQPDYLNAVVAIDTDLSPQEVLALANEIENKGQRERTVHWGPRTLDVDVLLYGDLTVSEPDLVIPHPRMWERSFVVMPLFDIAPDLVTAKQLAQAGGEVVRIDLELVLR